jgi:predicted DNA-binding transcriptional regulator AlpA
MDDELERLWSEEDLADYLGLSPKTILSMCSRSPDRLPPRVRALRKYRWVPGVVKAWVEQQSQGAAPTRAGRKPGRPRAPLP